MALTKMRKDFQTMIWSFYREHGRSFAWRHTDDPYHIVVSEIMLQQTQTYRVAPKYEEFIRVFPHFASLASAPLKEVLHQWQGLGYNRRGMYLHRIAQRVMQDYAGVLPTDPAVLETFPGIGKNTAGSICAFAFNKPVVFIETNIRAVFIHFFFNHVQQVHDKELLPLISEMLDVENSRHWYYALMDYGVMLKKNVLNPSRKSTHHIKQSRFEGSDRQVRGAIIRLLSNAEHAVSLDDLFKHISAENARVQTILATLIADGLVQQKNNTISIAS